MEAKLNEVQNDARQDRTRLLVALQLMPRDEQVTIELTTGMAVWTWDECNRRYWELQHFLWESQ